MTRFGDGRLARSLEAATMIMESLHGSPCPVHLKALPKRDKHHMNHHDLRRFLPEVSERAAGTEDAPEESAPQVPAPRELQDRGPQRGLPGPRLRGGGQPAEERAGALERAAGDVRAAQLRAHSPYLGGSEHASRISKRNTVRARILGLFSTY